MSDSVNKPPHYNQGEVETIDGIRAALGGGFVDYCRGNVLKYVWRCGKKGDAVEDLRKAAKYLQWAIEAMESKASETPNTSIPDPGPGYRLLSKDPPEPLQPGDDSFHPKNGNWYPSLLARDGDTAQKAGFYYRRKIEPTEWTPKVGDKVRVVKPGMKATGEVGFVTFKSELCFCVWLYNAGVVLDNFEAKDLELIEAAK